MSKIKITVSVPTEIEMDEESIGQALQGLLTNYLSEDFETIDGDLLTANGKVYLGDSEISANPNVAALVDAYNVLVNRRILKNYDAEDEDLLKK